MLWRAGEKIYFQGEKNELSGDVMRVGLPLIEHTDEHENRFKSMIRSAWQRECTLVMPWSICECG